MDDTTLHPFELELADSAIADLRDRINRTRWPDQLPGTGWELGTDSTYLRDLCSHWSSGFDFDAFRERCNLHPQVRTVVDGITVHAIVAEPSADDGVPLLLLHGWPGSVAEYSEVIEPLRARHRVVVASLPGYGFSGPTTRRGVGLQEISSTLVELMARLGHDRFVVAGGDWGSIVGATLASRHAERVLGLHLTLLPVAPQRREDPMAGVTDEERELMRRAREVMSTGTGYQAIQSTRPQSLAYGLTDSPAGLAGWILEKFHSWSDCHGDLGSTFTMDRLLENLSIYWFTGTINSSIRLYMEAMGSGRPMFPEARVEVPTGHAVYPGEIYHSPRAWAEEAYNIVHWRTMPRGGHFAAMEQPELYAADLAEFTQGLGAASG